MVPVCGLNSGPTTKTTRLGISFGRALWKGARKPPVFDFHVRKDPLGHQQATKDRCIVGNESRSVAANRPLATSSLERASRPYLFFMYGRTQSEVGHRNVRPIGAACGFTTCGHYGRDRTAD